VSSWVMPVNVTALQCLAEELAEVGGAQKAHYGAVWRSVKRLGGYRRDTRE